jgi:cytochrome c oxidase subunit 3
MGTVTMLFMGFTSAYVVRRVSVDWRPLHPPALLWLNTAVLALSSVALEVARRRGADFASARRWLTGVGILGALFVAGQLGAWRALARQGVFLSSNPHSSFFYVLTGLHGVHLLGGLVWFVVVWWRMRAPAARGILGLFATYWHYLGLLWLYLVLLLFVF